MIEAWRKSLQADKHINQLLALGRLSTAARSAIDARLAEANADDLHSVLPSYHDIEAGRVNEIALHEWGALTAATWLSTRVESNGTSETVGDCTPGEPLVFRGNLHVKGSLYSKALHALSDSPRDNQPALIVCGDLVIDGDWVIDYSHVLIGGNLFVGGSIAEKSDWSLTVVGGDTSCANGFTSCGEWYSGGDLIAPAIWLSYNHGHTDVFGHTSACLFVESDHRTWLAHPPAVNVSATMRTRIGVDGTTLANTGDLAALRSILVDEVAATLEYYVQQDKDIVDDAGDTYYFSEVAQEAVMAGLWKDGFFADPPPSVEELLTQAALAAFRDKISNT